MKTLSGSKRCRSHSLDISLDVQEEPVPELRELNSPEPSRSGLPIDGLGQKDAFVNACDRLSQLPSTAAVEIGKAIPLVIEALKACDEHTLQNLVEKATRVEGVHDRLLVYQSSTLELRLHVFHQGASETEVHNHRNTFATVCLAGEYRHLLWALRRAQSPAPKGHGIHAHERKDGQLQPGRRIPWELVEYHNHVFQAGQTMWVPDTVFHTVGCRGETPPITAAFRWIDSGGTTLVLRRSGGAVAFAAPVPMSDSDIQLAISAASAALQRTSDRQGMIFSPMPKEGDLLVPGSVRMLME